MATMDRATSAMTSADGCRAPTGEGRELRNLDLLRAIAVLSVLLAHLLAVVSFGTPAARVVWATDLGWFGVLIFFVHTALVLMLSMERSSVERAWASRFYVQRIFRIYPLSTLCLISVLAFRIPEGNFPFKWPSPTVLLANFALVQNFLPGPSILGPMWSLPFEIQMYVLLPIVFCFLRRNGPMSVAVLILASLILAIGEANLFARPFLTRFFPCFVGGVLAYAMLHRRAFFPGVAWPFAILGIAIAFYRFGPSTLVQWATCLVLGAAIPLFRDIGPGIVATAASLVARYSYGIYLAHLPLRWLCFEELRMPTWSRWTLFAALVSTVPVLLYHALEAPMVRMGRRAAMRFSGPSSRAIEAGVIRSTSIKAKLLLRKILPANAGTYGL